MKTNPTRAQKFDEPAERMAVPTPLTARPPRQFNGITLDKTASGLTQLQSESKLVLELVQDVLQKTANRLSPLLIESEDACEGPRPTFPTAPGFQDIRDNLCSIRFNLNAIERLVDRVDV